MNKHFESLCSLTETDVLANLEPLSNMTTSSENICEKMVEQTIQENETSKKSKPKSKPKKKQQATAIVQSDSDSNPASPSSSSSSSNSSSNDSSDSDQPESAKKSKSTKSKKSVSKSKSSSKEKDADDTDKLRLLEMELLRRIYREQLHHRRHGRRSLKRSHSETESSEEGSDSEHTSDEDVDDSESSDEAECCCRIHGHGSSKSKNKHKHASKHRKVSQKEAPKRKKKVIDQSATLSNYAERIMSSVTDEQLQELQDAYLSDFKLLPKVKDINKQPPEHHAVVLAAIAQGKNITIRGFTDENKKNNEYVTPLPNGEKRKDEGGDAKVVYVGSANRFTKHEESIYALKKEDVVYLS